MVLKFNGTTIENTGKVQYNGVDLDKVQLNGVTVWEKGFPGRSATASLTLPYQSNKMVWAYFKGTMFYSGEDYGLRVSDIVDNFNVGYGSQGYSATYNGYTITITSPQATGGDCNGQVFKVEYRRSFTGAADNTYQVALAGGSNAY